MGLVNKQIDLIDEAYENFEKQCVTGTGKKMTQEEFINFIKTDDEFCKMLNVTIETRELSEDERINLLHIKHGNKGHHIEAGFNMLDEFDIPTKLITITYNGQIQKSYE